MKAIDTNNNQRAASKIVVLLAAALAPLAGSMNATAQGTPAYVVSQQSNLSYYGGAQYNMAYNSRGDLFVNVGKNSTLAPSGTSAVLKFPANGGAPVAVFMIPSSLTYGQSGVAVDSSDNVYITNFYGPGSGRPNSQDSQIYELPFTNGSYPAPYTYSAGSPPGSCTPAVPAMAATPTTAATPAIPANTGVCAYGQYTAAAYYYWQPIDIAADGLGNTYMFTNYDNTNGGGGKGIFLCNLLCGQQGLGGNAIVLTTALANGIKSIGADQTGDVFWVDGSVVNLIANAPGFAAAQAAGSKTPAVITVFDSTYSSPQGVTFDKADNLYISDNTGVYEIPVVKTTSGGVTKETYVASSKFLLFALPAGGAVSPAVDTRGNITYSPHGYDLTKVQLWSYSFPAAPVGSGSGAQTFSVSFLAPSTQIKTITALQGSAPATEFTVSPGTCIGTFSANTSCTFTASFTPSAVGVRAGSIVMTDVSGKSTTTYLTGVGQGTSVTVDPGTPSTIGANFKTPSGLAVDNAGNVFVADSTANAVYEYPAGGGSAVTIGSNLSVPTGVAVDGAGNVVIVNQGTAATDKNGVGLGTIVEVPNVNGVLTTASQVTLFTGLKLPTDIAIDGDGNFFVTNTGNNEVLQYPSVSRYGSSSVAISLGYGLSGPTGMTIDLNGNVYVADTGNNRVVELGDGFQSVIGAGLSAPTGVAVEASGALLIADQGTGRLIRVPVEATGYNANDQIVLDSPLLYPYSIRLDTAGNLYGSDNQLATVIKLQRTAGTANFGSYNLLTTSGPQNIVLSSTGTMSTAGSTVTNSIPLGSPLYTNPPAATGFTVTAGSAATACSGTKLPSGYACTLSAVFSPTVTGASNYPLVLAAPATNTATPQVTLSGTGVNLAAATVTITRTSPTGTLAYGVPFTISVTVTPKGNTPTPTGLVVFSYDGQNQRPIALNGQGVASIVFSNQQAGQHSVQAHYLGDANYASVETALLQISITQSSVVNTLTVQGDSAQPLSSAPGDNVGLSVVLAPASPGLFDGTVTFEYGSTILGVVNVSGPDSKTKLYGAYLQVATLPLGTYNITAVYSGNANYQAATSATIPIVITSPTYSVVASSTAMTSTATSPGSITLTVSSYSNFQGAVNFTCHGLPANAYCVLRPGVVPLLPAPNTTPNTIFPVPTTLQIRVSQDPNVVATAGSLGWLGGAISLFGLLYWRRKQVKGGLLASGLVVLVALGGVMLLNGCGNTGVNSAYLTPAGNYAVLVTATATPVAGQGSQANSANNITEQFTINLTVK